MKITLGLFIVTTIAWLMLSFALNLDVIEGSIAAVRILGLESQPTEFVRNPDTDEIIKDAETGDRLRQNLTLDSFVVGINTFVFGLAYIFGTLIGLFATMPLVTGFLERGRIDLLLSKPISRAKLLAGHIGGVWAVVLLLTSYLIGGIWLVIALKTGVWQFTFLLAIPAITTMFAVIFSVVITTAIASRSSGLALVLAYGTIFISAILAARDQIVPQLSDLWGSLFVAMYHILPNYFEVMKIMTQQASGESVTSNYPLISSILFGVTVYAIGFIIFNRRDF